MARTRVSLVGAALVLAWVGLGWCAARGGEDVKSGPAVGGRTVPFTIHDVTGPEKGQSLCYV
jgi:hypothetical protein